MATQKIAELLERNRQFSTSLVPPYIADISRRLKSLDTPSSLVIISCSDPRVIPEEFFGLRRGDAAVIRNAGGRAADAIRSLAALDAIGNTGTVIIVHHTDCGMTHMPDAEIRKTLKARAPELSGEVDRMRFGEILDVDESVRDDIAFLKASPFLNKNLTVLGFSLDVHTGRLTEVSPKPVSDAEMRQKVLDDMHDFAPFWC